MDIDTGVVKPISQADIEQSVYLTATEKAKLKPKKVEGFDKTTGELIENQTTWRTAAFEHIFWLNQSGKATREYGMRFEEDFSINEDADIFMDAHANIRSNLDDILSGAFIESVKGSLEADTDVFMDRHADEEDKLDDLLSGNMEESKKLKESYRRIVSCGKSLVENELFVDFD